MSTDVGLGLKTIVISFLALLAFSWVVVYLSEYVVLILPVWRQEANFPAPQPPSENWTVQSRRSGCLLRHYARGWVTLECEKTRRIAGLAGISVSNEADALAGVDDAVKRLRTLTGGDYACDIVTLSADHNRSVAFAHCRIGRESLAEHLVLSGAAMPAPAASPAMLAISAEEQNVLRSLSRTAYQNRSGLWQDATRHIQQGEAEARIQTQKAEYIRAARLQVQSWVATLLGFIGVIAGYTYGLLKSATVLERRISESEKARDAFAKKLWALPSGKDSDFRAAAAALNTYSDALDRLGNISSTLPSNIKDSINQLREELKRNSYTIGADKPLDDAVIAFLNSVKTNQRVDR
jgi:hypothetical protein